VKREGHSNVSQAPPNARRNNPQIATATILTEIVDKHAHEKSGANSMASDMKRYNASLFRDHKKFESR
jgi:hypothetical protein